MGPINRTGALSAAGLAFILSASAARAEEHPLLATALALCKPAHARPAEVVAAAERAGWQRAVGGSVKVTKLVKEAPGQTLLLMVVSKEMDLDGVSAISHTCQVSAVAPTAGLVAAVQSFMGAAPQLDASAKMWIFSERDGRRTFLKDGTIAAVAAAVRTGPVVVISVPKGGELVEYDEVSAAH
jgi:hypothetical protein